jgi:hypothetical protein
MMSGMGISREVTVGERGAEWRSRGGGGRAAKAELLSGVEGVSSQPVRRIVLRA